MKFAALRQKSGSFAVDRQKFGHSFNGMISFSKQLGAAAKSSALCSGREYQYFAVFRQKIRSRNNWWPYRKGNPTKFAVLIQKIGLLLKVFSKNQMVFTKEGEEFHEICGFETKNPGHLRLLGRNLVTVSMGWYCFQNHGEPLRNAQRFAPAGNATISRFSDKKYEAGVSDDHTGKGILRNSRFSYRKLASFWRVLQKTGWFLWRKEKNFMKLAVLRRKIRVICGRSAEIWPWFWWDNIIFRTIGSRCKIRSAFLRQECRHFAVFRQKARSRSKRCPYGK